MLATSNFKQKTLYFQQIFSGSIFSKLHGQSLEYYLILV
jgi:hypothetical protein